MFKSINCPSAKMKHLCNFIKSKSQKSYITVSVGTNITNINVTNITHITKSFQITKNI